MIYIFIVNSKINMLVYNYVFNKFLLVVGYLKSKDIIICELAVLLRHRKIALVLQNLARKLQPICPCGWIWGPST